MAVGKTVFRRLARFSEKIHEFRLYFEFRPTIVISNPALKLLLTQAISSFY